MINENEDTINNFGKIKEYACEYMGKKLKEKGFEGLSPAHGEILFLLFKKENPISITEIVKETNKPKSTLTSNLRTLNKYGYINRISNPKDSRSCIIELSKKGKTLIPTFREVAEEVEMTLFKNVDNKEKALFQNLLNQMNKNIRLLNK